MDDYPQALRLTLPRFFHGGVKRHFFPVTYMHALHLVRPWVSICCRSAYAFIVGPALSDQIPQNRFVTNRFDPRSAKNTRKRSSRVDTNEPQTKHKRGACVKLTLANLKCQQFYYKPQNAFRMINPTVTLKRTFKVLSALVLGSCTSFCAYRAHSLVMDQKHVLLT